MPSRFLVPDLDPAAHEAALPPPEAHHLAKVLRMQVGDEVRVFDGRGLELTARVSSISRHGARVALLERLPASPAPGVAITIVQSVLKADAMDEVIRDCTMAGAAAIQPVVSDRTTVKAASLQKASERWGRIALAAVKQCGRSTLPRLMGVTPLAEWLAAERPAAAFLLVEPSAGGDVKTVRQLAVQPAPAAAALVVGPEGGWTAEEAAAARSAGCVPLSLGPLTLRAEAAAFAAAVTLNAIWDARGDG